MLMVVGGMLYAIHQKSLSNVCSMFFLWYRAVRLTEVIYLENNSMNVVLAVFNNIIIFITCQIYFTFILERRLIMSQTHIRIPIKTWVLVKRLPLGLLSSCCLHLTNWLLKKWTFQFRLDISFSSDRKDCQEYQLFSWNYLNKTKYPSLEKLEISINMVCINI